MGDPEQGQRGYDDFDAFVAELQREIDEQARAIYSETVIAEANNPKNVGRIEAPTAKGLVHGWCGDTMEIYLRLEGDRIAQATFMTDGCGPTLACGSRLTRMIHGLSIDEAGEIVPEDLIAALDGLPEESEHCATLAISTLQNAIFNWRGPPQRRS
jgi:nitrogen fixation NifU-like protein